MLGGVKMMKGGEMSPLVSFVLGAATAAVGVLFFMSASPGGRLVDVSAFTGGNSNATTEQLLQPVRLQEGAFDDHSAPAPAPVEVPFPFPPLQFFLLLVVLLVLHLCVQLLRLIIHPRAGSLLRGLLNYYGFEFRTR
jgi:hypothetical protein